jgi:signal transduction histidine kinase
MFTPLDSPSDLALLEGDGTPSPVVLAVGMDMTYRLDLERKNAEAEAMAAMGTLATSLAHEIRNPLNAARLQLELLQRRTAKFPDQEAAQRISEPAEIVRQELTRLSTLLNDFLNLARPRQLVPAVVHVSDLLESVATLKRPYAQSVGVTLHVATTDPSLTVRADADKLRQVLINLVGNAIEALADGDRPAKSVELGARATSDGIALTVTDNGPGISDEVAATLFRPFVTSKAGGTGLGLAIVAKLIAQHGGSVQVESRPEGGAIATCLIPS